MIKSDVKVGKDTKIFHPDLVNIYGCELGNNCKVGPFVEIQKGVKIGNNVKVSSHSFICEGVTIEDDVFIGHNVTFINDKFPKSTIDGKLQDENDWTCIPTLIKKGASLGSSCTILCGVTIGKNAMVGAGAVVTKDVPENTVVAGVPAKEIKK